MGPVSYTHLGLGARHAPVKLDDVAELAGERAAARELHADVEVIVEFQEIEAGDRRLGYVDLKFLRLEPPFARTRLPGFDEFVDDPFGFAEDKKIRRLIELRSRGDARPADSNRLSPRPAEIDDVKRVAPLRQHAAGQDQVGPVTVSYTHLFQISTIVCCALVNLFDGMDTQSIGVAAPFIAEGLGIKIANFGPIFSSALVGATIGAASFGPLADRLGRKTLLMIAIAFIGTFTILTAMANSCLLYTSRCV